MEQHDDFARATLNHRLQGFVKLVGRFADGEAATHVENRDAGGAPDIDFHWDAFGHG